MLEWTITGKHVHGRTAFTPGCRSQRLPCTLPTYCLLPFCDTRPTLQTLISGNTKRFSVYATVDLHLPNILNDVTNLFLESDFFLAYSYPFCLLQFVTEAKNCSISPNCPFV